ncbi:MAG TPA: NAD(P)-binding protein [Ilumatobacter sp.]
MEIAVVGGSLGGLTAACLLADDGHDVTVYERSSAPLEERGAGIGLLPMTSRYVSERGGVDLAAVSIATSFIRTLHRDGSVLHEVAHPYLFSSWNTVYREMLGCFDRDRYRLGHEMTVLDPTTPRIGFANGSHVEPDVVVCADGVGSAARRSFDPGASPDYAGYVAWRGVVPEVELSAATRSRLNDAITYYVYANSHILVYPIPARDGSVAEGDRLMNIVWYRNYRDGDDLADLMTDRSGTLREVSLPPGAVRDEHAAEARAVAAARLPGCIAEVVAMIDDLFVQVIYDLAVGRMVVGKAALIGDAAFAVRPHAAAGTAKAAADAWTLRDAFAAHPGDVAAALAAWEAPQLELGRTLLARTRAIGRRSQFDDRWVPGDPDLVFGLYAPGN